MSWAPLVLAPAGATLTTEERDFFRDVSPFGFILFDRNLETPDQIRRLTDALREAVGHPAPIFIDQEGGRVQRLRPPLARQWLPPLDEVKAAGERTERVMWARYRIIADELLKLGIDANCVPCLDLALPGTHPFLKNRCYASDPEAVSRIGRAVADACLAGGVLPVMKHMPGHGRAVTDSHVNLPRVDTAREELRQTDLVPFAALRDLPIGMSAHVVYESIDPARPGTLSPDVIGVIRQEIGFDGLLLTDDISMGALAGSVAQNAAEALGAGCDIVLHCNGEMGEMQAIAARVPAMTADAERRARRALKARRAPRSVDIRALWAKLEAARTGQQT